VPGRIEKTGAGIVITPAAPALEKGNDDCDFLFFCDLCERISLEPGMGFGESKARRLPVRQKVFAAEELVHADDCAPSDAASLILSDWRANRFSWRCFVDFIARGRW